MKKIKRIKVKESIDTWNEKHPVQIKKTAVTVGESIGVKSRSLSLWNKGNVPKQIQALSDIAKVLQVNFDDLFEISYFPTEDKVILQRIAIKEAFEQHNKTRRKQSFKTLSEQINYSELRLRMWNDGKLPFSIVNFFNFCKEVQIKHFKTLEY